MRYGVIGTGSMGRRRARHLVSLGAGPVVGFDLREDRRAQVVRETGIGAVATPDQMIDWCPDAVFICTPPADHLDDMRLAVDHGWHFMVENPAVHRLDGLDALIRDVEKQGILANVSCNLRFHEPIRAIKDLVAKEAVGPILAGIVEIGEWLPDWHPWEPYTDYYPSRRARGGGLDAICDLDWLVDIFGPVARAVAFAGKRSFLEIDTDDVVQILLEFGGGMQVVLHSDMIQRPYTHRAKFVGQGGTISWESGEQRVGVYRADAAVWEYVGEARIDPQMVSNKPGFEWVEAMYEEDTHHFLRCLAGEADPLNTLRSNGEALAVILGALDAGRAGRIWRAEGER